MSEHRKALWELCFLNTCHLWLSLDYIEMYKCIYVFLYLTLNSNNLLAEIFILNDRCLAERLQILTRTSLRMLENSRKKTYHFNISMESN